MCGNIQGIIDSGFFRFAIFLQHIFSRICFCFYFLSFLFLERKSRKNSSTSPTQFKARSYGHHTAHTHTQIAKQRMKSGEDFCINIIINASKHEAQLCYRTNPLSKWICFVLTLAVLIKKNRQRNRWGGKRRREPEWKNQRINGHA